jgi:hypothetical protein
LDVEGSGSRKTIWDFEYPNSKMCAAVSASTSDENGEVLELLELSPLELAIISIGLVIATVSGVDILHLDSFDPMIFLFAKKDKNGKKPKPNVPQRPASSVPESKRVISALGHAVQVASDGARVRTPSKKSFIAVVAGLAKDMMLAEKQKLAREIPYWLMARGVIFRYGAYEDQIRFALVFYAADGQAHEDILSLNMGAFEAVKNFVDSHYARIFPDAPEFALPFGMWTELMAAHEEYKSNPAGVIKFGSLLLAYSEVFADKLGYSQGAVKYGSLEFTYGRT